jgi:hypothetical protein
MVDQENMNHSSQTVEPPPKAAAENIGEAIRDIVSLVELQADLFRADTRESIRGLAGSAFLLGLAAALGAGTVPVALLFIAEALAAAFGMWYWLALLISTVLGLAGAAVMALVGRAVLSNSVRPFTRSREELRRNLHYLKEILERRDGNVRAKEREL